MAAVVISSQAHAGLLITKAGKVAFGDIIEKKDSIVVAVKVGETWGRITYKRKAVYWFTPDRRVTNHYLGAVLAYKKRAFAASKFLAKMSLKKEPKYNAKATELLRFIDALRKVEDPVAKAKKEIAEE